MRGDGRRGKRNKNKNKNKNDVFVDLEVKQISILMSSTSPRTGVGKEMSTWTASFK